MQSLLLASLVSWGAWKYALLFLGMLIEGDIALFTAGFLVAEGYFHWAPALVVLFLGTSVGDVVWYFFGRRFKHSTFFLFRIVHRLSRPFDHHLKKYPLHSLVISKYSIGIHRAMVFRTGMLDMPLVRFLKINTLATLLWLPGVGALGFISGTYFELVKHYVRYAEIGLLVAILVFVLFFHLVSRKGEEVLKS